MSSKHTVLCSDDHCDYFSGSGVYGICQNPVYSGQVAYGGITRTLTSGCIFRSPPKISEVKMDAHRLEILNEIMEMAMEEDTKNGRT